MSTLEIKGLVASVAGKQILNGIDLTIRSGEVHAVMGPNGAGKSTFSAVVMGKPGYEVHAGQVLLDGVDLLGLPTWQRAQAGMHHVDVTRQDIGHHLSLFRSKAKAPGHHIGRALVVARNHHGAYATLT